MSYVDTVDHQARRFGAIGTASVFAIAIAGFFLNVTLPVPPEKPVKESSLEVFPVPGIHEKHSDLKVFDVPTPVKPKPAPKPEKQKPQPQPPQKPQEASSSKQDEVDKSTPDPSQDRALAKLDLPTFWTPPPPGVDRVRDEKKEVKKVELPTLVVNDDHSEKKMDVNRPPRLVQAREQRMNDPEVLSAVRGLQRQLGSRRETGATAPQHQTVVDERIVQDGTVLLRFQVSSSGTISGCSVAVSSGSDVLDKRACELVSSFVYEAGTDERGNKVEKSMMETIEWLDGAPRASGQALPRPGVPASGSAQGAVGRRP
jgi:TonB family protein